MDFLHPEQEGAAAPPAFLVYFRPGKTDSSARNGDISCIRYQLIKPKCIAKSLCALGLLERKSSAVTREPHSALNLRVQGYLAHKKTPPHRTLR